MVTSTMMEADAVLDQMQSMCTVRYQSLYEASTASHQLLPELAVRDVQQLEAGQAVHGVREVVEHAVQLQRVQFSQLLRAGGRQPSGNCSQYAVMKQRRLVNCSSKMHCLL